MRAVVSLACAFGMGCDFFDSDIPASIPTDQFDLNCELYCAVIMRRCEETVAAFRSHESCMNACAAYPTNGAVGDSLGNTLQCRFTFTLAVRPDTRHIFCRTAGPTGGVSCVDGAQAAPTQLEQPDQ